MRAGATAFVNKRSSLHARRARVLGTKQRHVARVVSKTLVLLERGIVLLVDDNETLREGAQAIVKKMGHKTTIATSGSAASPAAMGRAAS